MNIYRSTCSPALDFAVVVNPLKEEPCLPMLVRAADLVGVEPTKVSTLVVVPEVKPRSCNKLQGIQDSVIVVAIIFWYPLSYLSGFYLLGEASLPPNSPAPPPPPKGLPVIIS